MRLIDADAIIKKWENVHCKDISFEMAVIGAINDIKKAPTVDAVPVIRCRECLYKPHCESYIITQQEDAYCSWAVRAERKEE